MDGLLQQVERGVAIITFANSSHAKKACGVRREFDSNPILRSY
jgi:hypothetical protein